MCDEREREREGGLKNMAGSTSATGFAMIARGFFLTVKFVFVQVSVLVQCAPLSPFHDNDKRQRVHIVQTAGAPYTRLSRSVGSRIQRIREKLAWKWWKGKDKRRTHQVAWERDRESVK